MCVLLGQACRIWLREKTGAFVLHFCTCVQPPPLPLVIGAKMEFATPPWQNQCSANALDLNAVSDGGERENVLNDLIRLILGLHSASLCSPRR